MLKPFEPNILLLGCGYTLTKFLKTLKPSQVLYTVSSQETLAQAAKHISKLFVGHSINLQNTSQLKDLIKKYPSIDTIVDSIPPNNIDSSTTEERITGAKNLAAALSNKPIKRFIYLSTTGVYGEENGGEVNEDTPCKPNNPASQARLATEAIYGKLTTNFCAFRIAAIYGPGRGLAIALQKKSFTLIKDNDRWSNRIHVDDLVEAIRAAVFYRGILPKVLCISDDKPALISEVVKHYCSKFSLPTPAEISKEAALQVGHHSLTSNQKVINLRLKSELKLILKYSSYLEGAGTEFRSC
jgi:nucleoside-diphosphate-sugar epimerase